jgi:hypothetical protein
VTSLHGWQLTDDSESTRLYINPDDGGHLVATTQALEFLNGAAYWQASDAFTGNKVPSYGGVLEYAFLFEIDPDAQGDATTQHVGNEDVILEVIWTWSQSLCDLFSML